MASHARLDEVPASEGLEPTLTEPGLRPGATGRSDGWRRRQDPSASREERKDREDVA